MILAPHKHHRPTQADPADRLPPQNLEAERSVLGSVLWDNDALDDVAMILDAPDFYRDTHQIIYRAIRDLRDAGAPVDAVTLADELVRRGQFEKIGGDAYLREVADSVPHAANARYYAGIVREKAMARGLADACTELLRACYANQHTAPDLVSMAERAIFAIGEREVGSDLADMEAIVAEAMDRIRRRQKGESAGLMTGFADLDYVLGGLRPGSLAILAARPSAGKTAMGMAIATNVGEATGLPPFFASLEMDRDELGDRLMSAHAGVDGYTIRSDARRLGAPEQGGEGWRRLYEAAGRLSGVPIRVDDSPTRTLAQIEATARRIKRADGLSMVMIDYLGLIDAQQQRGESTQEATARVSKGLKRMARHLGVVVLALHQLNRQSESRDDRRPRKSDLRDSGQIEQDADAILLLHRPEMYDPNDKPGIAEVIVAKNRNGATGTVELAFHKAFTRFDSLSRYRADDAACDAAEPF